MQKGPAAFSTGPFFLSRTNSIAIGIVRAAVRIVGHAVIVPVAVIAIGDPVPVAVVTVAVTVGTIVIATIVTVAVIIIAWRAGRDRHGGEANGDDCDLFHGG